MISDHDMIRAWTQVLTLSKLQAGQGVTVLTSASTHPQTLQTAIIAASAMGAIVNRLDLPPVNGELAHSRDPLAYLGTTPLTGNRAAIAALKESDLVLDLMTLLFSPEQHEILKAGAKILLAVEPPEVLARLVPTEADRTRVKAAAAKIEQAKEMHIVSDAGTDLRCALGEFPVISEYGFVAEPVRLTMKEGYCVAIEGGVDAALLRDYMASFNDPEAYAMSHIGWGLQPRARWSTLALYDRERTIGMDARAYEGNFLCSLGPNNEAGGSRNTACHIDIPIRNCTVRLDGVDMVTRGVVQDGLGRALA